MSYPTIQNFYFGRLELRGKKWEDKYVNNLFSLENTEISGKFKYGLFDLQELEFNNQKHVFGRLVKYKSRLEGEIVDESTRKVLEGGIDLGVVAKSDYYLDMRTGVIAFHPITNLLSESQFREMYARLFNAANHEFFIETTIKLSSEQIEIKEAIQEFQVVNRISYDIHPPNPTADPIYEKIIERLNHLKVVKMKGELIGGKDGLDKKALSEDDASLAIQMASDGFGNASVNGIVENRNVTITTRKSPIIKQVRITDRPIDVLKQLFPVFLRVSKQMPQ